MSAEQRRSDEAAERGRDEAVDSIHPFAAAAPAVPPATSDPLGLIAGEGVFPVLVARGARAAGRRVICAAFSGHAWPQLWRECDEFHWVGLLRLNQWVRVLRSAGCRETIMVGRVAKEGMYDRWRYFRYLPDWRAARLWFTVLRHDKRPQAILQALVRELEQSGLHVTDSTTYTSEHLATPGVMTTRHPTESQWIDVRFGWDVCKTISRMDVGQAIAVLNRDVIAVEAIEGTNAMIERAGRLCRSGGWTLIKVANALLDMRVDVPTVGVSTIEKVRAAGGRCIVLEPGKTIILEKPKVLELADRYRIAVVGYEG